MGVTRYNTDVNESRCAGGFVRVRGRCLGAVRVAAFTKGVKSAK